MNRTATDDDCLIAVGIEPTYNPVIPYSLITVFRPPISPLYLGIEELISFYLKTFNRSVGAVQSIA